MIDTMEKKIIHRFILGVLVATALTVGTIAASSSVAAQSDGQLSSNETEVLLSQGETQAVAVTYDSPPDVNPAGIQYTIQYDPSIVHVESHDSAGYTGGRVFTNNINTATGKINYIEGRVDGSGTNTDSGTVATLKLRPVVGVNEGETTTLEFSDVEITQFGPDNSVTLVPTESENITVQIEAGISLEEKVANLTAPTDALDFNDLQRAIQAYQNDEKIQGQELTFDALVSLIESYHEG